MKSSTANADDEIEFEFLPFLRLYRSGRVERFAGTEKVPATLDPLTGVDSKDVTIETSTGVSARLYLPPGIDEDEKLPILVYIHGGAFCIESAASPLYHRHLNDLASHTPLVAVSVEYRLAPEHPLPIAYEDAWAAFRWVFTLADPWLARHGDTRRVFLAGDSAGANISHQVALRAAAEGLAIKGMALIHSYFGGSAPVGSESTDPRERAEGYRIWQFLCPDLAGPDDPRRNPVADTAPSLALLGCERVLVTVAEHDLFKERGKLYYDKLKESGWRGEAEMVETPEADHIFHLLNPDGEQGKTKLKLLVNFFQKE
ncbi:hypothetical protein HPP92_005780 [Vanilla planifolia]|uniref:Alpha/beta hydrolase fold-3 domain-containing protein n=1 Tax=Vanilla planifolia TaxID=51239 RepID=A0A835VBA7_VANPL|nr:hypothetical protein HPP92_005780 [Vanilla planifolia]